MKGEPLPAHRDKSCRRWFPPLLPRAVVLMFSRKDQLEGDRQHLEKVHGVVHHGMLGHHRWRRMGVPCASEYKQ